MPIHKQDPTSRNTLCGDAGLVSTSPLYAVTCVQCLRMAQYAKQHKTTNERWSEYLKPTMIQAGYALPDVKALSLATAIHATTIYKYLRGQQLPIYPSVIDKLANALDRPVAEIEEVLRNGKGTPSTES